ncbi:MAG: OFA family oxalate/formate antiporter-like MFS transporter [Candidatus Pelagisphaera sp.]|jgi:OFA family oxalate/formate antiporter-like MFS transporter
MVLSRSVLSVSLSKLFSPNFPFRPKGLPFHYGWVVAVAGATGIVASIPGQTIGVNVFNDELIEALRISRSQVALAYFIGTATSGIMLFWAGKVYDRIGSRRLMVAANVGLGLSMLYMSCVDWLPRFAADVLGMDGPSRPMLVASLSLGFWMLRFSGQGFVTMGGRNMVAKWWRYHRGKVLPISGIGVSVCFSLSPLVFYDLIQATDWRVAWRILALCSGVGVALYGWLVYRDNPEECGLSIDAGIPPRDKQRDDPEFTVVKEFTREEAIRSFSFWVFCGIFALQSVFVTAYVFHVLDLAKELGMTPQGILKLFLPGALIGGVLSVAIGWLSDHFRLKYFAAFMACGTGLSSFALMTQIDGLMIPLMIAGMSINSGSFGPLTGAFVPRYFGIKHIGAVSGVMMSTMVIASATGPLLFSIVRDFTGSYQNAFGGTFVAAILLVIASFWANNPQRKIKKQMDAENEDRS